jgi:predicted nucleic acid-binding protein
MREIILPQSVLTESLYMLSRQGGNRLTASFLRALPSSKFNLEALTLEDIRRVAELLEKYADTRVDFVDASVAAVAERLNLIHILTIDRRDFSIIRPGHADFFTLLPEEA